MSAEAEVASEMVRSSATDDTVAREQRTADIVIIGGGPAGTTCGALLAQRGWRVLLLEKDRHPRFHIGESLLPLNLPLFVRMGCQPAIQNVGLKKHGVQFHSMEHQASQVFKFADTWEGLPKYARRYGKAASITAGSTGVVAL